MPPPSLQGLNIIHPVQESTSSDSRDLLLGQAYPDLSAQLDLWTSLDFESDEPLAQKGDEHKNSLQLLVDEEEEDARSPATEESAIRDGHTNVVTPTNLQNAGLSQNHGLINPAAAIAAAAATAAQSFDLNSILASFGLDSFAVAAAAAAQHPPLQQEIQQQHPPAIAPSLAQILALHSVHNVTYPPPGLLPYPLPPDNRGSGLSPPFVSNPTMVTTNSEESHGSAKRARTRKTSVTVDSPEDGSPMNTSSASSTSPDASNLTPLSASEDKRRRNTAASARFRLKKKEREAALEGKARELESKVLELERECEALRRENGWLKGLVVGVTGAAAQAPTQGLSGAPGIPMPSGTKRGRDDAGSS